MIVKSRQFGWGGLNTRSSATGLPLLDCTVLQDVRVVGLDLVQRKGIARIAQLAGDLRGVDLDGTNQYAWGAVDTRPWTLGTKWTLETAFEPDTTAGTQGIFTCATTTNAMILDITGGNIRFRVWDSGGTLDTITVGAADTATQTVQITRDGTTLSARLDNGTASTETMSSLDVRTPVGDIRVGRDDGSNYFNGTIDYVRLYSTVKSDHADRLIREPCPRAENVLADYTTLSSDTTFLYDRSRYENHLQFENSPSAITSLCHNPAPVRVVSMFRDKNRRKQVLVCAGGQYFLAGVD